MLNLLPPKQKKELRLRFLDRTITCFVISLILIILSLILCLFIAQTFLKISLKEKQTELNSWKDKPEIKELRELEDKIEQVNRNLVFLEKKLEQRVDFGLVLEELSVYTPLKIRIDDLSMNESGKIALSGYSPSRDSLLKFKQDLENCSHFKNFDFPLSNLAKANEIHFYFSFQFLEL